MCFLFIFRTPLSLFLYLSLPLLKLGSWRRRSWLGEPLTDGKRSGKYSVVCSAGGLNPVPGACVCRRSGCRVSSAALLRVLVLFFLFLHCVCFAIQFLHVSLPISEPFFLDTFDRFPYLAGRVSADRQAEHTYHSTVQLSSSAVPASRKRRVIVGREGGSKSLGVGTLQDVCRTAGMEYLTVTDDTCKLQRCRRSGYVPHLHSTL